MPKILTGRDLARAIMEMPDIDMPITCVNINSNQDEDDADAKNSFEAVQFSDDSGDGGRATLYYLGEVEAVDDDPE